MRKLYEIIAKRSDLFGQYFNYNSNKLDFVFIFDYDVLMEKNFDAWNTVKKGLHSHGIYRGFKEREIFYANVGENIGFEQCGKGDEFVRPVLIFRKFNRYVFSGIPLSTTSRRGIHYFAFDLKTSQSVALLSQMRLFDSKRLLNKLGMINQESFKQMKEQIKDLYGL